MEEATRKLFKAIYRLYPEQWPADEEAEEREAIQKEYDDDAKRLGLKRK